MAGVAVNTSGTQTATIGVEHTLCTLTTANVFQLEVNVTNMTSSGGTDDRLELRIYRKVVSGGASVLQRVFTLTGAQSEFSVMLPPEMSAVEWKTTLKQTQGTGRSYEWSALQAQ